MKLSPTPAFVAIFIAVSCLVAHAADPAKIKLILNCPDNSSCARIDQEVRAFVKSRSDLLEVKDGSEVVILRVEIAPASVKGGKGGQDTPIGYSVALLIQRNVDGKQWVVSRFGSAFVPYETLQASTKEMLAGAFK